MCNKIFNLFVIYIARIERNMFWIYLTIIDVWLARKFEVIDYCYDILEMMYREMMYRYVIFEEPSDILSAFSKSFLMGRLLPEK